MQMTAPFPPHRAFLFERPWQFAFGHVFQLKEDVVLDGPEFAGNEIGYWHCDIAKDRLSWTGQVYQLFGLPIGSEVARTEAVRCYKDGSRVILERLRSFSISNRYGFLLDARMSCYASGARNMRLLSVPIIYEGRVVGIHGLKRVI